MKFVITNQNWDDNFDEVRSAYINIYVIIKLATSRRQVICNNLVYDAMDFRSAHVTQFLITNRDQFCLTCFPDCIAIHCLILA